MNEIINTSVLVIDDDEIVRDNIEEILVPANHFKEEDSISRAAGILFDSPKPLLAPRYSNIPNFTVDKAANGMEGLEKIKASIEHGTPYAVIFIDMRMPGWDGLETAVEIQKYDSKAEIIFVTAYSDRSIEDIVSKAGQNVGYHCKPYASDEIIQLATKAVSDYNKLRNLEKIIEIISSISLNETQLNTLLHNILDQLAAYVDTDMALLGKLHDDYTYEKIFSIGALEEKINLSELINRIKTINIVHNQVVQIDEVVLARLDNYTIFAVLKQQERLKTEKLYLLKLFVENAAKAIRNAELYEQLLQKEKLSAVGKAISMVMHDLRPPIQYIKILTGLMREENIQSKWLVALDQCSEQVSEIFEDFLDFVKETPVKMLPVNLSNVIEHGIKMADSKNNISEITINKKLIDGLMVSGDESKLKRSIMNLVNNAADALKDNKISNPTIDILVEADENNKQVIITLKDNGIGIPADIIKTVFEPFVTKQKHNGTGLGLAIVKQYITAHGGDITVENNNGAVFTITLPYAA